MTERIVLAYSGGLDTSVAIGWIHDATGADVIACAVDVGQGGEDLEVVRQRALDCGAVCAARPGSQWSGTPTTTSGRARAPSQRSIRSPNATEVTRTCTPVACVYPALCARTHARS